MHRTRSVVRHEENKGGRSFRSTTGEIIIKT